MIFPKAWIVKHKLIEGLKDIQLQPAGVDLTLWKAFKYTSAGRIDFDNKERKISETEEIPFDKDGWIFLTKGAYKVRFNEYVKIPRNAVAFAFPRTSLLRSGATIENGLWDPGYEGRSECMLLVMNEKGIYLKKNARIAQLVFALLPEETEEYKGIYNEKYFDY